MWDRRKQLVPSLKCFKSVTMPKTECSENAAAWVIRFGSTKPSTYRSWKTDGAWQRHWCHRALVFRENWSCYEKAYGQEASKQSFYARLFLFVSSQSCQPEWLWPQSNSYLATATTSPAQVSIMQQCRVTNLLTKLILCNYKLQANRS